MRKNVSFSGDSSNFKWSEFFEDLSKNSEKLISYIRPNKTNKNVLYSEDGTMLSLEKKYLNSK